MFASIFLAFYIVLVLTNLNPILTGRGGGGQNTPTPVFRQHPKMAQAIKLKLSDFKDTPLTLLTLGF